MHEMDPRDPRVVQQAAHAQAQQYYGMAQQQQQQQHYQHQHQHQQQVQNQYAQQQQVQQQPYVYGSSQYPTLSAPPAPQQFPRYGLPPSPVTVQQQQYYNHPPPPSPHMPTGQPQYPGYPSQYPIPPLPSLPAHHNMIAQQHHVPQFTVSTANHYPAPPPVFHSPPPIRAPSRSFAPDPSSPAVKVATENRPPVGGSFPSVPPAGLPPKPKKAKTQARILRETARKLRHRERRRIGRRERRIAQKKAEDDAILAAGGTLPERKEGDDKEGDEGDSDSGGSDDDERDSDGDVPMPMPATATALKMNGAVFVVADTPAAVNQNKPPANTDAVDMSGRITTHQHETPDNKVPPEAHALHNARISPAPAPPMLAPLHATESKLHGVEKLVPSSPHFNHNESLAASQSAPSPAPAQPQQQPQPPSPASKYGIETTTNNDITESTPSDKTIAQSSDEVFVAKPPHEITTTISGPHREVPKSATQNKPHEQTKDTTLDSNKDLCEVTSTRLNTVEDVASTYAGYTAGVTAIVQLQTNTGSKTLPTAMSNNNDDTYRFGQNNGPNPNNDFNFSNQAASDISRDFADRLGPSNRGPGREGDSYRPGNDRRNDRRGGVPSRNTRQHQRNAPKPAWAPPAAHDRPILRVAREKTPPQYHGMTAAEQDAREDKDAPMDLNSEAENGETKEGSDEHEAKRVKSTAVIDLTETIPIVAPAPEKRMDFINQIRAMKSEAHIGKRNAISDNEDFISFDAISDDEDEKRQKAGAAGVLGKPVPTGPAFSHRDFHHGQRSPPPSAPIGPKAMGTMNLQSTGKSDYERAMRDVQYDRERNEDESRGNSRERLQKGKRSHSEYEGPRRLSKVEETPWLRPDGLHEKSMYPSVWLHKEVHDFYEYIRPRPYEEAVRQDLIVRTKAAIQREFADADILSFGSFPAKLYLPTSDMDLVMVSSSYMSGGNGTYNSKILQKKVQQLLNRSGIARGFPILISSAKVPIIKYIDKLTGLNVDISFENLSGMKAIDTFKRWKEIYPDMPKVVMLVKHFLSQRSMNEPYNGGIGSFTVICLVVSLLQLLPECASGNMEDGSTYPLGRILMEFLDLYGSKFNHHLLGIRVDKPGYYKKDQVGFKNPKQGWLLSIMDPHDHTNDISRASYRVKEVFHAFSLAHEGLEQQMAVIHRATIEERRGESMLDCIVGGDFGDVNKQRKLMQNAYLSRNLGTMADLYDQDVTRHDDDDDDDSDYNAVPGSSRSRSHTSRPRSRNVARTRNQHQPPASGKVDQNQKQPPPVPSKKPNKKTKARAATEVALASGNIPLPPKVKKVQAEAKNSNKKSKPDHAVNETVKLRRRAAKKAKKAAKIAKAGQAGEAGKTGKTGKAKVTKMGPHDVITID